MFIYLSKVLPQFFLPVGLGLLQLLVALWMCRRQRRARWVLLLGLLTLALPATPLCADALMRSLEDRFPAVSAAQAPVADAIVILGGGTTGRTPEQPEVEISQSGVRLLHGFRLYRVGKAPVILLSGDGLTPGDSEAGQMKVILREWGVPEAALLLEERSRNTHENAVESAALAERRGLRRLLLVTSAFHMRRALALFRHEGAPRGLTVLPAATGRYSVYRRPFRLLAVLPDVGALATSTLALREHVGILVYKMRGWL